MRCAAFPPGDRVPDWAICPAALRLARCAPLHTGAAVIAHGPKWNARRVRNAGEDAIRQGHGDEAAATTTLAAGAHGRRGRALNKTRPSARTQPHRHTPGAAKVHAGDNWPPGPSRRVPCRAHRWPDTVGKAAPLAPANQDCSKHAKSQATAHIANTRCVAVQQIGRKMQPAAAARSTRLHMGSMNKPDLPCHALALTAPPSNNLGPTLHLALFRTHSLFASFPPRRPPCLPPPVP